MESYYYSFVLPALSPSPALRDSRPLSIYLALSPSIRPCLVLALSFHSLVLSLYLLHSPPLLAPLQPQEGHSEGEEDATSALSDAEFLGFYEDVLYEMQKFGEVTNFKVTGSNTHAHALACTHTQIF